MFLIISNIIKIKNCIKQTVRYDRNHNKMKNCIKQTVDHTVKNKDVKISLLTARLKIKICQ